MSVSGQQALGDWQVGRSTFYDGIDGGNCGFETIPSAQFPFRFVAAANTAFFASSAACGQCFEVKCTDSVYLANACVNGSVIVEVTDQCPCGGNEGYCCGDRVHFDLSPGAFTKIANVNAGVINTLFRPVACPVQGNVQVKIKTGSNAWWFALLVNNVGGSGSVTKVELSSGNTGAWVAAARQDYNYWLTTSGTGLQFPLGVRVWQGAQSVTGTLASLSAGSVFSLSANFGSGTIVPSPAAASPSSSPAAPSPSPSSAPSSPSPMPSSTPSSTPAHSGGCFIPNP